MKTDTSKQTKRKGLLKSRMRLMAIAIMVQFKGVVVARMVCSAQCTLLLLSDGTREEGAGDAGVLSRWPREVCRF